MKRTLDLNNKESFNEWIWKSMQLFHNTPYLDNILEVYNFTLKEPQRLDEVDRRKIVRMHQSRNTEELVKTLKELGTFPYDDPVWGILKRIEGCLENNPRQIKRIANNLYEMTAEETVVRLESPPKMSRQMGQMFRNWLFENFELLEINDFISSEEGIYVLSSSEDAALEFLREKYKQEVSKRPDMVAKVDNKYIIGEAKWISGAGGAQTKQVEEVLLFCSKQRGSLTRVGIVDGYPWAQYKDKEKGKVIRNKEAVKIQESAYDIVSALLLEEYLKSFQNS